MHEMCALPQKSGGVLVWHVMAKQTTTTLCEQELDQRVAAHNAQQLLFVVSAPFANFMSAAHTDSVRTEKQRSDHSLAWARTHQHAPDAPRRSEGHGCYSTWGTRAGELWLGP